MPKLGATPFGYQIAEQFGLKVLPTRAGLVPFTLHDKDKEELAELSGVAIDVTAQVNDTQFKEAMLFTHRGLSGPSMLQVSSYWEPGDEVDIDLAPECDGEAWLNEKRNENPDSLLSTCLYSLFPKRVAQTLLEWFEWPNKPIKQFNPCELKSMGEALNHWQVKPNGTEGYRTAEVTLGGVDTDEISSKTMMAKKVEGLFFIGEVVDVTGWLGGYNFQWAWSSGWAAGQVV